MLHALLRIVTVPVVQIRSMGMIVLRRLMPVRVAVLAGDRRLVLVHVVSVVVPVGMLVLERFVPMTMLMRFGDVKVNGDPEQDTRRRDENEIFSVTERVSQRGTDERRESK
jgi:hypothetical protein